jgi:hypothetical protein
MTKKIIATTAAILFAGTAAIATPLTFNGMSEYSVETESLSFALGTNYEYKDFDVFANVDLSKPTSEGVSFDSAEIGAAYYLNANVKIYGKVVTDESLTYSDTVIGAAFTF